MIGQNFFHVLVKNMLPKNKNLRQYLMVAGAIAAVYLVYAFVVKKPPFAK
tara:strand:+ start:23275 stop:23424 length:150 start_codon:yes stop_codon:yes gene_type:complete